MKPDTASGETPVQSQCFLELEIAGDSMYPNFIAGDHIRAVKMKPEFIRMWDVVFFLSLSRSRPILFHRVWRKRRLKDGDYEFITKGDPNINWDDPIRSGSLLGVGVAVKKESKWVPIDRWQVRVIHGLKGLLCLPFISASVNFKKAGLAASAKLYRLCSGKCGIFWKISRRVLLRFWCFSKPRDKEKYDDTQAFTECLSTPPDRQPSHPS